MLALCPAAAVTYFLLVLCLGVTIPYVGFVSRSDLLSLGSIPSVGLGSCCDLLSLGFES